MNENSVKVNTEGDVLGVAGTNQGTVNFNISYISQTNSEAQIHARKLLKGSPYLGLEKFDVEDSDKFFGRDRWIVELTDYLERENVLLLLGASGSGKSSLIQAGLIPKLKDQGNLPFLNFTFVPDVDPFESFYGCLLTKYKQAEAKTARVVAEDTLVKVVESLKKEDTQWLIFIDQFEELFTRTPQKERDVFVKSLVQFLEKADPTVKLVMTMRADFLDKFTPYPALGRIHDRHSRMLTDMEDGDLRLAIAEPAARNGVTFEKGLIEQIIVDFRQQAGSLPLLQYTLNLLWRNDDIQDRVLNRETYERLGRVKGALQQQADKIYAKFDDIQRKIAEQIFLELITLEGEKSVSRRIEKSTFEKDEDQRKVLEYLIENRLLVSNGKDGKATVEVAHEELLRSWKMLRSLIYTKKEILIWRGRLYADAQQWYELHKQNSQKAKDELWSGLKLSRILELIKKQFLPNLNPIARQFIRESINHQKQLKTIEAERKQREINSELSLANSLSQYALSLFNEGKELEACIEIIKAGKIFQKHKEINKNVINIFQKILFEVKEYNRLEYHQDSIRDVSFSPDGSLLASGSFDKTIKIWNVKTGQEIYTLNGHTDAIQSVNFSPDGSLLASGSSDKTIKLWDIKTGQEIHTFSGHLDAVVSVNFHPISNLLVSGSFDGTIKFWDTKTRTELHTTNTGEGNIYSISISPDGNTFASSSHPSEFGEVVKRWNIETRLEIASLEGYDEDDRIFNVNYSPDGKILASCGFSLLGNIIVWDIESETQAQIEMAHNGDEILSIDFSSDGKILATGSCDKTIKFWNIERIFDSDFGRVNLPPIYKNHKDYCCVLTIYAHTEEVSSVCFSPDGKMLASGSYDKTVKFWKINTRKKMPNFNENDNEEYDISKSGNSNSNVMEIRQAEETSKLSDLDYLITQTCNWIRSYLTYNPNVSESDRHLCDDISTQQ